MLLIFVAQRQVVDAWFLIDFCLLYKGAEEWGNPIFREQPKISAQIVKQCMIDKREQNLAYRKTYSVSLR